MARYALFVAFMACLLAAVSAAVIYKETFDNSWESRWIHSEHRADFGKFIVSAGKHYNDAEQDKGLQTSQDARFYAISSKMSHEFNNKGKDLVFQFQIKHEQNIDCGGGYIKLMPAPLEQKQFYGETEYSIMFGPDICGSTKKIHFILNYKGKNVLWKKEPRAESDTLSHLYTLLLKHDNTYEVYVDMKKVESGNLADDWDLLKPRKIRDPSAKKPADWVDDKEIPDPSDKKPEGYDDIPAQIPDSSAKKPDDWNEEADGKWEPPMIDNPAFKGAWKQRMIPNPAYKGVWEAPLIDNPEFVDDKELYLRKPIAFVGIDLWQVRSGTIFDNILVADNLQDAFSFAETTFKKLADAEKRIKDEEEKKKKEEEEAKKKEEPKAAAPATEQRDAKLEDLKKAAKDEL